MIVLWIALFLLVVGISFVLAYQSMRNYSEIPGESKEEYGLFLIRQIDYFDASILGSIRELLAGKDLIVSIERLFKGSQVALAIYGPRVVLDQFVGSLNLLELEDYTQGLTVQDISVWEVGVRFRSRLSEEDIGSISQALPKLETEDQFFWQVVVGKDQIQIRAALFCQDSDRRKTLLSELQNSKLGKLIKIPRPYTGEQMWEFYRQRVLSKDSRGPILDTAGLIRLLKLS